MKDDMTRTVVNWGVMAFLAAAILSKRGTEWEFGRFGLPKVLVAGDGAHYVKGKEIDPMTLWLVHHHADELLWLGIVGTIVVSVAILVVLKVWRG